MKTAAKVKSTWRNGIAVLALAVIVLIATGPVARAQTAGSATILGKVVDQSGGIIPGVTVTVSSPALQVRTQTAITDAAGSYRFVDLPPGSYSLKYELLGFQTVVRDDVRLNAGFTAQINISLKVSTVSETVTISGQAPVVDVSTASASTNFTKEMLDKAPIATTMWQILAMTPGIRSSSMPDVGGSTLGTQQGYSNYGSTGQVKPEIEGIDTREGTDSAGSYYDDRTAEEVQVKGVGNDAEMALPGTNYVEIVKSGGNQFHGSYFGGFESSGLQRSNLDDHLRSLGVGNGSALEHFWDISGDVGGRIVRDKLWFYTAYRNQRNVNSVPGFASAPGPDATYGTGDDVFGSQLNSLVNYTMKLSYQPTRKFKLVAFGMAMRKVLPNRGGTRYRPAENSWDFYFPTETWKVEAQGSPSDRLLWDVLIGRHYQSGQYYAQSGVDVPGNPTHYNRTTRVYTGPTEDSYRHTQFRWQSSGSVSWFPRRSFAGNHSIKTGYHVTREFYGSEYYSKNSGDYMLTYDNVGGALQGVELETLNSPIIGLGARMTEGSGYIKDTWRVGQRLTLNPGVRFGRYHSFVTPQNKIQGAFGNSGAFPGIDVLTWLSWAPRFGLAYDLTGNGKTVIKSTAGWYNWTMGSPYADNYNQNVSVATAYQWQDLNGNGDYDPGEVDLDVNGPDFISVDGGSNNINNTNLKQPRTYEVTAGVDRELISNFSARVLYVYRRTANLYSFVNVLRPYDAWNIPITRTDPGPDGALNTADDGAPVTFDDYDPAYAGAAFVGNEEINRPAGRDDWFQTIELTLNKRASNGWNMLTSLSATKNHAWIDGSRGTNAANPQSPNDAFFPIDDTWSWQFKAVGGYEFPKGIRLGAFYQLLSGDPAARSYVFRRADPAGGLAIDQANTVTLRLEPLGSERFPVMQVLNLRLSKAFNLNRGRALTFQADLFNAFNANTMDNISYVEGPTFGKPSSFLPPMIARFGASFSF